jgi:hypothetical protein
MNRPASAVSLVNGGVAPLAEVPVLDFDVFAEEIVEEVGREGRVAAFFATPAAGGDGFDLFVLVAHDWRGNLALLRSGVI